MCMRLKFKNYHYYLPSRIMQIEESIVIEDYSCTVPSHFFSVSRTILNIFLYCSLIIITASHRKRRTRLYVINGYKEVLLQLRCRFSNDVDSL